MNCGTVCLVHYPFIDQTAAKLRPALVVSADKFNGSADVVIVPISSTPDRADPHAEYLDDTETWFSGTGLRRSSSVKWTKPLTVAKTVIQRRLGVLPDAQLRSVIANLKTLFEV